jgi:predicted nucleic acid-binding protein
MGSRKRRPPARQAETLILDAGAVIALSRGDQRARVLLRLALREGRAAMPSVVVAETVRGRGPRDAAVNRVIDQVDHVEALDEKTARAAGALLGRTRMDATIDAIVVATAERLAPARILTGDPKDMRALARGTGVIVHAL